MSWLDSGFHWDLVFVLPPVIAGFVLWLRAERRFEREGRDD